MKGKKKEVTKWKERRIKEEEEEERGEKKGVGVIRCTFELYTTSFLTINTTSLSLTFFIPPCDLSFNLFTSLITQIFKVIAHTNPQRQLSFHPTTLHYSESCVIHLHSPRFRYYCFSSPSSLSSDSFYIINFFSFIISLPIFHFLSLHFSLFLG